MQKYRAVKFVKESRRDILVNSSFKKFITQSIQNMDLAVNLRKSVIESLTNWRVREIIEHADLSPNQKKLIFERVVGSDEFKSCCKVFESGVPTRIPNMTEAIMTTINYCIANKLPIV